VESESLKLPNQGIHYCVELQGWKKQEVTFAEVQEVLMGGQALQMATYLL